MVGLGYRYGSLSSWCFKPLCGHFLCCLEDSMALRNRSATHGLKLLASCLFILLQLLVLLVYLGIGCLGAFVDVCGWNWVESWHLCRTSSLESGCFLSSFYLFGCGICRQGGRTGEVGIVIFLYLYVVQLRVKGSCFSQDPKARISQVNMILGTITLIRLFSCRFHLATGLKYFDGIEA